MKAKHILVASIVLLFATANARLVSEIDKDIVKLRNEATALQKNPIVVWGSKQEKLSPEQKKATSRYNINLAQAKERKNYKSKIVITLNPEYVCSVHKLVYKNGRAACPSDCKSISRIGTSNFCNLGSQYDLSFRTWNLLKDKMPEGEAQEKRLKEIEQEIRALRDEKLEAEGKKPKKQTAQDENVAEEKKEDGAKLQPKSCKIYDLDVAGLKVFGRDVNEFAADIVKLGGKVLPAKISRNDTTYVKTVVLPKGKEFLGIFDELDINANSKNEIYGLRFHARQRIASKQNDLVKLETWLWQVGLDKQKGFRKHLYANAHGYWADDMYVGVGISVYAWLFVDFVREDMEK